MPLYTHSQTKLAQLQQVMQELNLWSDTAPTEQAFASTEPFALDHMSPTEWLQWVFIPKMQALVESRAELPKQIAITPYLEEAMKEEDVNVLAPLLARVAELEQLLQNQ